MSEQIDRFYIIGFPKGKSHLAYFNDSELVLYCIPTCEVYVGNPCMGDKPADKRDAERCQQYYNEVTCPTCLKKALSKPSKPNPQLTLIGVSHE